MDFNTQIYLNSQINKFRKATGLKDLTLGELYAIVKFANIKPINGTENLFSRYDINCLLNSHRLLADATMKIIDDRKAAGKINNQEKTKYTLNFSLGSIPPKNYYTNKEMGNASNELLRKDEVFFEDENDDKLYESLFGRKVFFTEQQIKTIKENIGGQIDKITIPKDTYNTPDGVVIMINNEKLALEWEANNATTFIAYTDGIVKFSSFPGQAHGCMIETMVFKMLEDPADFYDKNAYQEAYKKVTKNIALRGRFWQYVNGKYNIFSYWSTHEVGGRGGDIKEITTNVCNKMGLNIDTTYIANGEEIIKLTDYTNNNIVDTEKEREALNIHNMGADVKRKTPQIQAFLKNRNNIQNKRNSDDGWGNATQAEINFWKNKGIAESKNKSVKNDRGEIVPEKCPTCGSKVGLYIQGEPIYRCSNKKCGRYFGVMPFPKKLNESTNTVDPSKVLLVDRYLNDNFVRASAPIIGEDGNATTLLIVGMKGTDGQVIKNMTAKQLFYKLQDKFQKIFADKDKRDKFLLQVMKDWYNKKISKEGLLSVNKY